MPEGGLRLGGRKDNKTMNTKTNKNPNETNSCRCREGERCTCGSKCACPNCGCGKHCGK